MPHDSHSARRSGAVQQPHIIDLNATVTGIERTLRRLVGEQIEVVMKLDPGACPVVAEAERIEQVVLNLALDACDGMTHGGVLIVETANVRFDGSNSSTDAGPGATHVMLAVTDTGTGFGRAMVHGLVKRSGGHCRLRRQPGRGTTFCVYLPAFAAPAARTGSELPPSLERRLVVT